MIVNEEYIIYGVVAFVGQVGGMFGIFIGFSITGFISSAFDFFKKLHEFFKKFKCARRIYNSGNKEIPKFDGNSVEMENDDNHTRILNRNDFSREIIQVKQVLKSRSTQTRVVDKNRKKIKKQKQKIQKDFELKVAIFTR